jgi:DNA-directed RNA polymerase specialized sigma24 family protein
MLESAWDEFPRSLVKKVARHAEQFTELTWPTNPPAGLPSRVKAPGVLYPYLKALVLRQRREQAEQRHLEADQRRAERQAEAERLRAERIRLKEEARQARLDQVRDGMERGWTNREIGSDLGVSLGTVEKLKREVRRGEAWDRNSEERAARLDRAREALGLQGQGRSRAEIGQRMSLSEATVKMLLRDAKFYIDPDSDPARRRLACAAAPARRDGATRAKFQCDQGLSKPKSTEAWKDADVLEPSGTSDND